jgi:hypothetical protein
MMIYGGCNIGKVYKFSKFIYKSSENLKNTKNMKIPKTTYKNTKEKMSDAPLN